MKSTRTGKPQTINEYLARVRPDQRGALNKLRRSIRAAFPRAQECISYGMPAFRLNGRVVAWFGAGRNHCAFYPGGVTEEFKSELVDYQTSKGTIRFQPDHLLPATLVRRLIKARIARDAERVARKRKPAR